MINYEDMDDLRYLSKKDKLKIVKKEVDKIDSINELLLNALKYNRHDEFAHAYIHASQLIGSAVWNIKKMFPFNIL